MRYKNRRMNPHRAKLLKFLQDEWLSKGQGRTIKELIGELGCTRQTWNDWRNGADMRPANVRQVAAFFGLTEEQIRTGQMSPEADPRTLNNCVVILEALLKYEEKTGTVLHQDERIRLVGLIARALGHKELSHQDVLDYLGLKPQGDPSARPA